MEKEIPAWVQQYPQEEWGWRLEQAAEKAAQEKAGIAERESEKEFIARMERYRVERELSRPRDRDR